MFVQTGKDIRFDVPQIRIDLAVPRTFETRQDDQYAEPLAVDGNPIFGEIFSQKRCSRSLTDVL